MKYSSGKFLLSIFLSISMLLASCKKEEDNTVYDMDGNQYQTKTIGTQTWMLENLKTTKYNDGTPISLVTDQREWAFLSPPGYCSYNNDDSHIEKYGLLYNWNAVKTGKLAPKGWHIPTDTEWQTLIDYLIANGYNYDGTTKDNKIAKSLGITKDWALSNMSGTLGSSDYPEYANKSGFNAVPGGCRSWNFEMMGYGSYWWCIYNNNMDDPHRIDIYYNFPQTFINPANLSQGFSIRCIKD